MTPTASSTERFVSWQGAAAFHAARSVAQAKLDAFKAASLTIAPQRASRFQADQVQAMPHKPEPTTTGPMPLSLESLFVRDLLQHRRVFAEMTALRSAICDAAVLMADALHRGGRLLFVGDPGSATSAQLLAQWFGDRLRSERKPAPAIALGAHGPAMTALAGTPGHPEGLARLLAAYGRVGDCVVALSATGHATNVLRALSRARDMGIATVALLGHEGGAAAQLADMAVVVPSDAETLIQETHLFIGHSWCSQIESALAPLH